jgi:hypothetical protein
MTQLRDEFVDTPYEEPATPLEVTVARIAGTVLDVDRIGRTDSFYDFGCTSLQAIRICTRIDRETHRRVPPAWLFDHDILADFAARLQRQEGQDHD